MYFQEKKIALKDGRIAVFRSPALDDAAEMVAYMRKTAGETDFLLRTPEEVTMTVAEEEMYLSRIAASEYDCMIVCIVDGILAGNCQISRHNKRKNCHRADVMIALLKEFWNLGIGTAMFREMITLAENWGLLQLELEVIEGNHRAIGLYEKMGFQTAASRPNAIRLPDGTMLREFLMVKTLSIQQTG